MDRWTTRAAELAGAPAVLWEDQTWPRLRALRHGSSGVVLLPVGATEQHGPHLPLSTDSAIATGVAAYASSRTRVTMLPALRYGVSVGHTTAWPGTLSTMHGTLAGAIREIVSWLVAHEWRRVLVVNAHFGNDATLRIAVDRLRFDYGRDLQINTLNTWTLSPEVRDYFVSDGNDFHANRAETDLMLFLDPEWVDMRACEDDEDRTGGLVFSYLVPATSKNGVTGMPSLGNAEAGRELLARMGDSLAEIVQRAKVEEAPLAAPLVEPRGARAAASPLLLLMD
jgi:creatinine amidohydrolase